MGRRTTNQIDAQMLNGGLMKAAVKDVAGNIVRTVVTTLALAGVSGIVIASMLSCQGATVQFHACRRAIVQTVKEWQ